MDLELKNKVAVILPYGVHYIACYICSCILISSGARKR
jgi:hypothetical protein